MGVSADIEIRRVRPEELDAVAELYWRTWHESQAKPGATGNSREPDPDVLRAPRRRLAGFAAWRVVDEIDDPHPVAGQSTAPRIWLMVKDLDRS